MSASIHQEISFKVSPQRVYSALTDAAQFQAFTGGAPAEIANVAGGAFSCFGGMIVGRNIELVPNQRIVQAWRARNWNEGVYSIVCFVVNGKGPETQLVFDQTGFPEEHREHLDAGWHKMYWEPLRKYLGALGARTTPQLPHPIDTAGGVMDISARLRQLKKKRSTGSAVNRSSQRNNSGAPGRT